MALGEIQWLQFKNKKTRERDEREYAEWAFPYGKEHEEKVTALLKELDPKESPQVAKVCLLTAKEIAERVHKIIDMPEHRDYAIKCLAKDLKRYKSIFRKPEYRAIYCVLGFIELDMTPALNYPTADEIRIKANELLPELLKYGK
ncbi:MAG: hypothetical protein IJ017_04030 [Oscillospiraceae bacterium]|nr:hypothetical protein [Oscillospiraceae bacterium]